MTDIPPDAPGWKRPAAFLGSIVLLVLIGVIAVALSSSPSHSITASAEPTSPSVAPTSPTTTVPTAGPPAPSSSDLTVPSSTAPMPSSTAPSTTSAPTTAPSVSTTTKSDFSSAPVAVPGGSFRVTNGNVALTHVVVRGDTLFGIAAWYKLMGGVTALYNWNHSTVGSDPNLIYPGEVLTVTVPQKDIPKISPVYLAETVQGASSTTVATSPAG